MSGYIEELARHSAQENTVSASLLKKVLATDEAASILPKFADLAMRHSAI
jgi:hypothetical protein